MDNIILYLHHKSVAVTDWTHIDQDNDNSYHYYAGKGLIDVRIIQKLKQFLYSFKLACNTDYSGLEVCFKDITYLYKGGG